MANSSGTEITKTVHPFFTKASRNQDGDFIWHSTIHRNGTKIATCLHATYQNPEPRKRIAAFDLDGTVIDTRSGSPFPKSKDDWKFMYSSVPPKIAQAHKDGYGVVFLTNQNYVGKKLENFKEKMENVAQKLKVPFRLFAATEKDYFRKPMPGMWEQFCKNFNNDLEIDYNDSFFIGDAAGRRDDHSDVDRKLALNVGLKFQTPEEYFKNEKPHAFNLTGLDIVKYLEDAPNKNHDLDKLEILSNTNDSSTKQEIVLFVGYPGSGKSSLYFDHFEKLGYDRINQDTLKTKQRCEKVLRQCLNDGKSAVIDNTNRDCATRAGYIEIAKEHKVQIRVINFTASGGLAYHANVYRAFCAPPEKQSPYIPILAYTSFNKDYEQPSVEEGFDSVIEVNPIYQKCSKDGPDYDKYWLMRLGLGIKQEKSLALLHPAPSTPDSASQRSPKRQKLN